MFGNKKIFVLGGFAPHPLLAKTGFSRESTPLIRNVISRMRGFDLHGERVLHASTPTRTARGDHAGSLKATSDAEFGFEQIAHGLRVGFAAG
jgi:hypothetical protein